jgi:hypothetical protein
MFICGGQELEQKVVLAALEAEIGDKFSVDKVDLGPVEEEAMKALERGEYRPATRGLTFPSQFQEVVERADFWESCENEGLGAEGVRESGVEERSVLIWSTDGRPRGPNGLSLIKGTSCQLTADLRNERTSEISVYTSKGCKDISSERF